MPDTKKTEDEKTPPRPLITESAEDDDDLDFAWQLLGEHDRREAEAAAEAAKPKQPIDRLKEALANLSAVYGNEPPPEDDNELTDEDRQSIRAILSAGAGLEPKKNAEASPVNMYTAKPKPLGE